jgi:hypothetical protein
MLPMRPLLLPSDGCAHLAVASSSTRWSLAPARQICTAAVGGPQRAVRDAPDRLAICAVLFRHCIGQLTIIHAAERLVFDLQLEHEKNISSTKY